MKILAYLPRPFNTIAEFDSIREFQYAKRVFRARWVPKLFLSFLLDCGISKTNWPYMEKHLEYIRTLKPIPYNKNGIPKNTPTEELFGMNADLYAEYLQTIREQKEKEHREGLSGVEKLIREAEDT